MVTCQGCGETTSSRLCCPKCTEAGRTSFFCSQDCFRVSWPSHSKLHAVIQRGAPLGAPRGGPLSESTTDSREDSQRREGTGSQDEEQDPSSSSSSSGISSSSSSSSTGARLQQQRGNSRGRETAAAAAAANELRGEETPNGNGEGSPSLPVVPSRVSRGLGLIQARGAARSSSSSSSSGSRSGGSPSKASASGFLSRFFPSSSKRPMEIPLHVRGDKRDTAGKGLSPAAAAAAAATGAPTGLSLRTPLLLLLLLGALLCYITFGGLLFSATGGPLGGPHASSLQQQDDAAAAAAAPPTLQSLAEAVLHIRDELNVFKGLVREHEALLGALAPHPSPGVSSAAAAASAAAGSRAQRAAGVLGGSVASYLNAAGTADVGAPGVAAARAQPLLQLLERLREASATAEQALATATAAEGSLSVSSPLSHRSYVAGVATEGSGPSIETEIPAASPPAASPATAPQAEPIAAVAGPAAAGTAAAPAQQEQQQRQQQEQQQQQQQQDEEDEETPEWQEAAEAAAPTSDALSDGATTMDAAAGDEGGDRGLGASALLARSGYMKRSKRGPFP